MSTTASGGGLSKLTPLVLRLSVAAIMGYSGYANVVPGKSQLPIEPPISTDVDEAAPAASTLPVTEDAQAVGDTAKAVVDESGLTVQADWSTVTGVLQLGLAGVLLVGFLTRLTGLGLLGGAAYSMIASHGVLESTGQSLPIEVYQSSPMAVMLLAAVGLTLLVSGYGLLGLDGLLFNRARSSKMAGDDIA